MRLNGLRPMPTKRWKRPTMRRGEKPKVWTVIWPKITGKKSMGYRMEAAAMLQLVLTDRKRGFKIVVTEDK